MLQLLEAVRKGDVERGCIPVENSLAGTIHKNYDLVRLPPPSLSLAFSRCSVLLLHSSADLQDGCGCGCGLQLLAHDLHIVGEVTIPIHHCLMVNKGVQLSDVKVVASHPVALAQCEVFIKEHGMQKEVAYDTAGSAEMLMKSGDRNSAAIAGKTAAERYGLDIVAKSIQDETNNYTRFLILSRRPSSPPAGTKSRTTFLIGLPNKAGSLVHALTVFSMRGLDLSKLESRPLPAGSLGDSIRGTHHSHHSREAA